MTEPFEDIAPSDDELTPYDRTHMKLYMRLLDADRERADWREVVQVLFGLDANSEPERARGIHDSHLARARWMTEHGYRQLVREGTRH
ncbi:DUF2285 domain-containing protein [Mesorhizobium sp. M2A.F.Ca.ET.042.01.1.1]|uniref:DNA -binding domain-containing protein n=1 Tax=Mesorhizobium sp. M2A.F.Ca.ET.042.01.1.1 TaxID=2496745 RepID=UPI000FCB79C4|nr:DUF2285 domain-containing protein [Mesorhizobium sp. M2A.F.Ca.ET.042.01.1.1]RUX28591.1 DUF2285 domain-containing protein [Mesorhizobium sp. M2A.F.Ca.ET.042.01.1.1]